MMASLTFYDSQNIDEFLIYSDNKQIVTLPERMYVEISMISDYISVLQDIYEMQQSTLSEGKEIDLISLKNQYYLPIMEIDKGFHTFWQDNAKLGDFGLDMSPNDYGLKLCNELFYDFTNSIDENTTKDEYKESLSGVFLILQLYGHLATLINSEYDMQGLKLSYRFLNHMNNSMAFQAFVKSNSYVFYLILTMLICISVIIVFLGSYADEKQEEMKHQEIKYPSYKGTYKRLRRRG